MIPIVIAAVTLMTLGVQPAGFGGSVDAARDQRLNRADEGPHPDHHDQQREGEPQPKCGLRLWDHAPPTLPAERGESKALRHRRAQTLLPLAVEVIRFSGERRVARHPAQFAPGAGRADAHAGEQRLAVGPELLEHLRLRPRLDGGPGDPGDRVLADMAR